MRRDGDSQAGSVTKECARCGASKPLDEFGRRSDSDNPKSWCKSCCRAYGRKWMAVTRTDKDKRARQNAQRRLWLNGLTQEKFDALIERQQCRCAVCLAPLDLSDPRKSPIDHDHRCCPPGGKPRCGKCVRGILCARCNTVLGMVVEDCDLLSRLASYVETVTVRQGR